MPRLAAVFESRPLDTMHFRDWQLYHQIHPVKLATDVGVTPVALYCLWEHQAVLAGLIAFVPPSLVSLAMLRWTPDLEALKRSQLGRYIGTYMTPTIQMIRLLTLVPIAYGAWNHNLEFIVFGLVVLALAWCSGVVHKLFARSKP